MESMGNLRRTHYCGEVRLADAGQEMVVAGSIAKCRDKGGIIFCRSARYHRNSAAGVRRFHRPGGVPEGGGR